MTRQGLLWREVRSQNLEKEDEGKGKRKSIWLGDSICRIPESLKDRVCSRTRTLSYGSVDKKEEAGPVRVWLRGDRKEFALYPKSNEKMLTHVQRDLVQFLLLLKPGLLEYNLH